MLTFASAPSVDWPSRYYRRARHLQWSAIGMLLSCILLLAAGAYSFVFARSIASYGSAASSTVQQRIEDISRHIGSDEAKSSVLGSEMSIRNAKEMSDLTQFTSDFAKKHNGLTAVGPPAGMMGPHGAGPPFNFVYLEVPYGDSLARKIQAFELPEGQSQFAITTTAGQINALIVSLDKPSWQQLAKTLIEREDGKNSKDLQTKNQKELSDIQNDLAFSRNVLEGLRRRQIDDAVNADRERNEGSISTRDLINTTVTRFGSVALISFLVSILLSLYKYNMRLAAFYAARGDALRMTNFEDDKTNNLTELLGLLTPSYEFGRTPAAPLEQIVELLKAANELKDGKKP